MCIGYKMIKLRKLLRIEDSSWVNKSKRFNFFLVDTSFISKN